MATTPPAWTNAVTRPTARTPLGTRKAVVKPTGLTAKFLANPLLFMRTHSMSPPSDSMLISMYTKETKNATNQADKVPLRGYVGDLGTVAKTVVAPESNFKNKEEQTITHRTGGGGIRFVQFIQHPSKDFPGAIGLEFLESGVAPDGSWVPIQWLPWKNLQIITTKLDPVPQSMVEWDDDEFPRFFFTAGINGCSVFASGHPHGPTISHAGLETELALSSGKFWRTQMEKCKTGWGSEAIKGEINRHDYMFNGGTSQKLAEEYKDFIASPGTKEFKMEVQSPFGCVFGIRYGRAWTLYLQKSVIYNEIRFHKESEIDATVINPHRTDLTVKGTGKLASVAIQQVKKGFGPFARTKDVKIFSTSRKFSMPLQVEEMFPSRRTIGQLKDTFTLKTGRSQGF